MASVLNLQFHSVSFQPGIICLVKNHHHQNCIHHFRTELGLFCSIDWNRKNLHRRSNISFRRFSLKAQLTTDHDNNNNDIIQIKASPVEETTTTDSNNDNNNNNNIIIIEKNNNNNNNVDFKNQVSKLQQAVISLPAIKLVMKRQFAPNIAISLSILATILVVAVRGYVLNKSRNKRSGGSVADLVRRGQLKYDRRGISATLKYDDPFNNPMVKVGKSDSTIEMCGKVYRMEPVTLTREQQAIHQKRRSRAYEWKRPTVFLKEGDPIPAGVDPETIRWIPANHPFATTASDIDEDLAQNNVNLKRGVPFRVQAEHEALQKKLEALQSEQKLNKLVIDPSATNMDFGRPFNPHQKSDESIEPNASSSHHVSEFSESENVAFGNGKEDEVPKT